MIYEISNPSDSVTIESDDLDVGRAACLLLGGGKYGLKGEDGATVLPIFILCSYDEWAAEHGFDLDAILADKREAVSACLMSAVCCSLGERVAIVAAVGKDEDAFARFNEKRRSSLNDICGRAFDYARKLREVPA